MGTSVDFFPDGELQMTAKAQPTSGNPVRIEFLDGTRCVADFTIFTRSPPLAVRLEHAINFIMRSKDTAVTRDAIEELIGSSETELYEQTLARVPDVAALLNERDQLYHHVQDLIQFVDLIKRTLTPEERTTINENSALADAAAYLTQIEPPPLTLGVDSAAE